MKPIADRAEVAVDFPDKTWMGSFTRLSRFEAKVEPEGVALKLARGAGGEHRSIEMHLHWGLLAEILTDLADGMTAATELDLQHRLALSAAAARFAAAMEPTAPESQMPEANTPESKTPD